ncbi:disease resistance protein Pik-2-like [Triticum dicoccoides]|uniref:disease resistance protein Pik-2-like n=1 Tax=Triticum dicoccoides TaxID=85692 RepID=UPI0018914485|nr:disease resistance protein Pik-2-like [Triticum dicoccoides]
MELVVGGSRATMGSLLSKLGRLLSDEYTLIRGVEGDLQYINDELATMQSFLRAYDGSHGDLMKDWMKQIRDITYDIEDCIDDSGNRIRGLRISMRCYCLVNGVYEIFTWWTRRDIASKLSLLKMRAQQIGERRERYGVFNAAESGAGEVHAGSKAPGFDVADNQAPGLLQLVTTREPVGVEDLMKKPHKRVTCIVGFGGVGKTAIATTLYRNAGQEFGHRAVVTVSQSTDLEAILRNIRDQVKLLTSNHEQQDRSEKKNSFVTAAVKGVLGQVSRGSSSVMAAICCRPSNADQEREIDILKQDIAKHLNGNRYLVLIDDVWSQSLLDTIINALPNDENSIIIVTTRFHDVATTQREADIRSVHGLVEEKSKNLFIQAYNESKGSKGVTTRLQTPTPTAKSKEESSKKAASETEDSKYGHNPAESSKQAASESEGRKDGHKNPAESSKQAPSESGGSKNGHSPAESSKQAASESDGSKNGHNPAESSKQAASESEGSKDDPFPEQVWKICGGLPLAIITMAGHVACNPGKEHQYWQKVCEDIFPESRKDGPENLTQEEVSRIVSHCYNDMPAEIQTCSLYLSIFPKGCKISRKRLTRRWIAEGIVCEKDGLGVDVIAETYFNHLIRRKIIQPVEHNGNGKVKKCVVHDMVLELIVRKASEENFITVVGGNWFMQPPSSKVRRLSIQDRDFKHAKDTEKMNLSHVRSLTIFGSLKKQLSSHSFKFGIVQVLDLEGCKDFKQHHIVEICEMLLLKYLSLRKTDTKQLPDNIGKLKNLETLDIRETEVFELPKAVCQLQWLVNILGGNKTTRKALRLPRNLKKKMKALQILSGIEIVEGSSDLRHLTKLRKLAIYKLETMLSSMCLEELRSSIEYLGGCSLQTLIIDDESSDFVKSMDGLTSPPRFLVSLELSGKMIKLPKWIKKLNVLNKLTLSLTALRTDNLRDLSELDALFSLTFCSRGKQEDQQTLAIVAENKMFSKGVITVLAGGFKSLKLLCLSGALLPLLSFSSKAMPELERLEIRYSMLEGILGVKYLAKLEEFHLTSDNKDNEDMMTKEIARELGVLRRIDGKGPRVILHQGPLGMKPSSA